MMPGPYHEFSRMQSSERVERAFKEGKAKQVSKHDHHRSVYGLLVVWAIFMSALVGLWVVWG